jgi:hypothetical protein
MPNGIARVLRLATGSTLLALALGACRSATPMYAPSVLDSRLSLVTPGPSSELEAPAAHRVAPVAPEEPYPNLYRRAALSLGIAAYSNFDTTLRVDSDSLAGAVLDLEDTLGVDDSSSVGRLDGHYSFSRRHRVDFTYYDIRRDGTRTTQDDINFGEITIPAGSGVETDFGTRIIKLAYRYNFVADTRTVIGASFGFHTMGLDIAMKTTAGTLQESFNQALPLPVFGLHGEYALSEKWRMLASLEIFRIDLSPFEGFLSDQRLAIEHDTWEHFGWGVGTNSFTLDAEAEGNGSLSADVEYAFSGIMLYLRGSL